MRPRPRPLTRRPLVRRAAAVGSALALGLSLVACGGGDDEASDAEMRTFEADNGEVEIPADPQRVIATGYAVPALLEADADLVGISEWSRGVNLMTDDDLATYEDLEKVAGETAASTNYEAIANLDPDLIVIGVPQPALVDIDMERLEGVAPVVVIGPTRPDKWRELTQRQSDAAGVIGSYDEAKATYEARAAELAATFAPVLEGQEFGHLGGYGDVSAGNFQREFAGSWGTNVAGDVGVDYYGEVADPQGGSSDVSEYPSIEELPESLGDADWITYTVQDDGTPSEAVQYVLDSELWQGLPAVRAGHVIPLRYTEAATYTSALTTLDGIDEAFREAFAAELG